MDPWCTRSRCNVMFFVFLIVRESRAVLMVAVDIVAIVMMEINVLRIIVKVLCANPSLFQIVVLSIRIVRMGSCV